MLAATLQLAQLMSQAATPTSETSVSNYFGVKRLWDGVPWGFYTNYPDYADPNITNFMLTDAMSTAAGRQNVEQQLRGMAARNATLWRIFPQFQDVLSGPSTVNASGIAVLTEALDMAHKLGIRVTVTGLSDFVPARNPGWLNKLGQAKDSEAQISAASAVWWGALASAWKGHPAVWSFDLMNEPVWQTGPRTPTPGSNKWATGCMGTMNDSKCFDFLHNRHWQHTWTEWVHANFGDNSSDATLRAAWPDFPMSTNDTWQHPQIPTPVGLFKRPTPEAAPRYANYSTHMADMQRAWAVALVSSIKNADSTRLVSVGELFPAGCRPYSDVLDFYSVHLYPPNDINTTTGLRTHFQQQMAELPNDNKPVFVEEFFPLGLNPAISVVDYLQIFTQVVSPRARAFTTYFCPTTGVLKEYCEGWLALVATYAAQNATATAENNEAGMSV
jgi:hypothetical protein